MPDLKFEICKRCDFLKVDLIRDDENPMPLICEKKTCNSHWDTRRAIIGFMNVPEIYAEGSQWNLVKAYWKEIKGTLKKDDFIMNFHIPDECPYRLEHLVG